MIVASKRGRKMFSSIFPKLGSSFFDLNMSLGRTKTMIRVGPIAPLGCLRLTSVTSSGSSCHHLNTQSGVRGVA